MRKREIKYGWVMGAISPMLGCNLNGASGCAISPMLQAARSGKWMGVISPMLGCDEIGAIWGWVCFGVVCGISPTLLSLHNLGFGSFFFFFFFGNGLKVSLERGFGPWGGTIWAGRSLDMGFEPCEECA